MSIEMSQYPVYSREELREKAIEKIMKKNLPNIDQLKQEARSSESVINIANGLCDKLSGDNDYVNHIKNPHLREKALQKFIKKQTESITPLRDQE